MNHYITSDGERVSQGQIDYRTSKAKEEVRLEMMNEHGYLFCEMEGCGRSDKPPERSHIISVAQAKGMGKPELCWDKKNIEMLCRDCHLKVESLSRDERIERYESKFQ